jgi:hypothetical protein
MPAEKFPECIYMTSGNPILGHHLKTLELAQKELNRDIPLIVVANGAKNTHRIFSPQENLELFKKGNEGGAFEGEIFALELRELVAEYIQNAEIIIRRKEKGLDSNSPHIKKISEYFEDPTYAQKIHWIGDPEHTFPEDHTSSRFNALVYNALNDPDEKEREKCYQQALKMAISATSGDNQDKKAKFLIEETQQRFRENPKLREYLSIV